jgi:hypothetical protein
MGQDGASPAGREVLDDGRREAKVPVKSAKNCDIKQALLSEPVVDPIVRVADPDLTKAALFGTRLRMSAFAAGSRFGNARRFGRTRRF